MPHTMLNPSASKDKSLLVITASVLALHFVLVLWAALTNSYVPPRHLPSPKRLVVQTITLSPKPTTTSLITENIEIEKPYEQPAQQTPPIPHQTLPVEIPPPPQPQPPLPPDPVPQEIAVSAPVDAPEPKPEPAAPKPKEEIKPPTPKPTTPKKTTPAKTTPVKPVVKTKPKPPVKPKPTPKPAPTPKAPTKTENTKAAAKTEKDNADKIVADKKAAEKVAAEKKAADKIVAEKRVAAELQLKKEAEQQAAVKARQQELLSQAQERIAKIGQSRDKVTTNKLAALSESSIPATITSLHVDAVSSGSTPLNDREITYRDELASRLKLLLKLPEYGEVKVKLTLGRAGKVVKVEVLSAESTINRKHIEKTLPNLTFPSFGTNFGELQQYTFAVTLSNEL